MKRIKRFIADTFGGCIFRLIRRLPYFWGGVKIMAWIIQHETPDPNENK